MKENHWGNQVGRFQRSPSQITDMSLQFYVINIVTSQKMILEIWFQQIFNTCKPKDHDEVMNDIWGIVKMVSYCGF